MLYMIYQELRLARQRQGMTLKELATLTGIAQPNLSRLERAKVDARLSTLSTVADALGLTVTLTDRTVLSIDDVQNRMTNGSRKLTRAGLGDRAAARRLEWKRRRGLDTTAEERVLE